MVCKLLYLKVFMHMKLSILLLVFSLLSLRGAEFTVVAYNVENLFDVDGVSLFDDYEQGAEEDTQLYSRYKLLTKLRNTARVLKSVNDGQGPEILMLQELEVDFTSPSQAFDYERFLRQYRAVDVVQMLDTNWKAEYADIPAAAWLFKALEDSGMRGYAACVAPNKPTDARIAHVNAVFSKFPILESKAHPLNRARDILEVKVSVEGRPVWLYVNHWKSGASNPKLESVRVGNAEVLRQLVDARLKADPYADIIVGGDLNSHYNQSVLFPEVETGISDVLGAAGVERMLETDLYNLWYELEPEARFSEVWRGRRGSLMHLILTRGLYDQRGVSYVDNSFKTLLIEGVNVDALHRPIDWTFFGQYGGGYSDHLPVMARFTTDGFRPRGAPSTGLDALDYEPKVDVEDLNFGALENGSVLNGLSDGELALRYGEVFRVRAKVVSENPLKLEVEGQVWASYAYDKDLYQKLSRRVNGSAMDLIVQFSVYKGQPQFIVEAIR